MSPTPISMDAAMREWLRMPYEIKLLYKGRADMTIKGALDGKMISRNGPQIIAQTSNIRIVPFTGNENADDAVAIYELVKLPEEKDLTSVKVE